MIFFHEIFVFLMLSPLILIPIEKLLPYPYIIEELFKFLAVCGFANRKKSHLLSPILGGFLFALVETFLYIPNIMVMGQPHIIFERLLKTGGMHIITMLIMYVGVRKKFVIGLLTLILSMTIHYFFNIYFNSF